MAGEDLKYGADEVKDLYPNLNAAVEVPLT